MKTSGIPKSDLTDVRTEPYRIIPIDAYCMQSRLTADCCVLNLLTWHIIAVVPIYDYGLRFTET